jgi:uncharacterized coiled-coil protein SlyX
MDQNLEELYQRLEELEILVLNLEDTVSYLSRENIETTNELYELQNRLDILNHPKYTGLERFSLGDA